MPTVLICSYVEPELVEVIRGVDERLDVRYHPELLPRPRYVADHIGAPLERTDAEQVRWEALLGAAEILFDFDYTGLRQLPERAPNVRWVQATSAGIGQLVRRHDLDRMDARFTTASGVHARPLAEFVMMTILEHVKRADLARRQQRERTWRRFATGELTGKTLAVIGYGRIGTEVARLAKAFDMRVVAVKRHAAGADPATPGVDGVHGPADLHAVLAQADYVCLITPHTLETEGLMDEAAFRAMRPGAMLVNIARGAVVDEAALLAALDSGHLSHATLDVTAVEPLPTGSPLWTHPAVTIYPHSASTSERENERIVELFCDNLRRYLAGAPLLNVLDTARLY